MDHHGDDDAGETSTVKPKIQPMKPSDQEIATREACGHYPYREWCLACVGGAGQSDARKRQRKEQNSFHVASMHSMVSSLMDRNQRRENTKGATPFFWW